MEDAVIEACNWLHAWLEMNDIESQKIESQSHHEYCQRTGFSSSNNIIINSTVLWRMSQNDLKTQQKINMSIIFTKDKLRLYNSLLAVYCVPPIPRRKFFSLPIFKRLHCFVPVIFSVVLYIFLSFNQYNHCWSAFFSIEILVKLNFYTILLSTDF